MAAIETMSYRQSEKKGWVNPEDASLQIGGETVVTVKMM